MENRKWKMENGKWKMENGKWKMKNGKWKMENGEWSNTRNTPYVTFAPNHVPHCPIVLS